jgi:DNA-binding HxlR family transcriptional regulator
MDLIGGAWTPNIIWFLTENPRRFSELIDDIGEISPKVLTTRLRKMEASGIVVRQVRPTSPPTVEYSLSELGRELLPAIKSIVNVGMKLREPHDRHVS